MKLSYSSEALEDLDAILILIASRDGIDPAFSFVEKLQGFCAGIADSPFMGTLQPQIAPGIRRVGYRRQATVLFYSDQEEVRIERVFYSGSDWPSV